MPKIILVSILIIIISAVFSYAAKALVPKDVTVIDPNNPDILYTGRVDFTNPLAPRFDWPGVMVQANFTGTCCGIILEDSGSNDYNVFIDGRQMKNIKAKKGLSVYMISRSLKTGSHSLLITKRTEGYDGICSFKGLVIAKGESILPPPQRPKKKIEFIGDSITVGFGIEGPGIKCSEERKYKNNYLAYGPVASRMLDAECHIEAISGRGVVRNWAEKGKVSNDPMPSYFNRTCQNDPDLKWDFKSWVPDAVVINLGANDFSTEPKPDRDVFITGYLDLIKTVRNHYKDADIFCVLGPAQQPPFYDYMDIIFSQVNDRKVHKLTLRPVPQDELGCDWHPNVKANKKMADELVKQIKETLGW